jgi:two-component system response regulator AtoC
MSMEMSGDDVPGEYDALANSPCMRRIDATVRRVACTDVTVLISGESGVGKEVVARALHRRSSRRDRPFVKVNCAALPPELLESELFGHERGAFTGAERQAKGKFEQAHTGTIFLDEIGEMPPALQAKLLQVLQDHEFARVGGDHDIRVDVRIIAATNRDLEKYVGQGGFREDLFYRLNVLHIRVPPLRERREEIPGLVEYFLERYAGKHQRRPSRVSAETLERFRRYHWPGNVRELENVVQRLVILGDESVVDELAATRPEPEAPTPANETPQEDDGLGLKDLVRRAAETAERDALKRMLERVRWRRVEAAQRLRISDKTLRDKIKHYGLDRSDS